MGPPGEGGYFIFNSAYQSVLALNLFVFFIKLFKFPRGENSCKILLPEHQILAQPIWDMMFWGGEGWETGLHPALAPGRLNRLIK